MMSPSTIREMSRDAAKRAARARKEPWEATPDALERGRNGDTSGVEIPFLGDHVPKGWERINLMEPKRGWHEDVDGFGAYFVDTSGFGGSGEPALTQKQLMEVLLPGYGYALIECGQFQGYVGVFRRK